MLGLGQIHTPNQTISMQLPLGHLQVLKGKEIAEKEARL